MDFASVFSLAVEVAVGAATLDAALVEDAVCRQDQNSCII